MRTKLAPTAFLCLVFGLAGWNAQAATFTVINDDDPGEGLNDPTVVAPVAGNPGTTLGQQRLNVLLAAAELWGKHLESDVEILISTEVNPLPCDESSATEGAASPVAVFSNFSGAPRADTWYPVALANALAGSDLDLDSPDILARFNGDIDTDPNCLTGVTWWYGIGASAPAGTLDFFNKALHELAHGLGFATLVDLATGVRFFDTDDIFMTFLEDHSTGKLWTEMSNAERAASAIDTGDLHWVGSKVVARSGQLSAGADASGHVQMYAPASIDPGFSVVHWDTAVVPEELMEPFAVDGAKLYLGLFLLEDLGWKLKQIFTDGFESGDTSSWTLEVPP